MDSATKKCIQMNKSAGYQAAVKGGRKQTGLTGYCQEAYNEGWSVGRRTAAARGIKAMQEKDYVIEVARDAEIVDRTGEGPLEEGPDGELRPITIDNPKDAVGSAKVPSSTRSAAVDMEIGVAMMEGARKYGRHNYRVASIKASVYYDAIMRHMAAWWEGEDVDPDSGLSHITKALATLYVLRDCQITGQFNDDRPPALPEGWMNGLNKRAAALVEKYPEPKAAVTRKDSNETK